MDRDRPTLREADEGKTVVDAAGESIGMVTAVRDDGFYVYPDPSLVDRIKATLDWEGHGEEAYRIDRARVVRITGSEVQIGDEGADEGAEERPEGASDAVSGEEDPARRGAGDRDESA